MRYPTHAEVVDPGAADQELSAIAENLAGRGWIGWAFAIVAVAVGLYVAAILFLGDPARTYPSADDVEARILESTATLDVPAVSASCPGDGFTAIGEEMTCFVGWADGSTRRVHVRLASEDGWLSFDSLSP